MYIDFEKKFDLDVENLNNPVLLIGWPGIALVGKIAIGAVIDSIKADLLYDITFFDFPPKSNIEMGMMDIPSAKLYYKSRKNQDLFILTGDYQPQSPEGVFDFSMQFCKQMEAVTDGKIKMYVSCGAMITEKPVVGKPKVYVCGTDQKIIKSFLKYPNTELMESGVIAGANGILPSWAGNKGFAPGISLLAESMPMRMINLDPKASKELVTLLKEYFDIDMNYDELNKKIEEMEEMFDKFKEQASNFMKDYSQDEGTDSYFR